MNRHQLTVAIHAAKTFLHSAELALRVLDQQRDQWESYFAQHEERPVRKLMRLPSDRLDGCKESGQCKRDSLDLTRRLAELRKP